jgi:adenylosuccinate synthase
MYICSRYNEVHEEERLNGTTREGGGPGTADHRRVGWHEAVLLPDTSRINAQDPYLRFVLSFLDSIRAITVPSLIASPRGDVSNLSITS